MMTFPTEWKNKSNVPNHQPVKRWGKEQINSTKKRYKRLLRCFDGKSHVVKKGLTRVNFESCWDHDFFGTWTCQTSWNFPGTGVARPDGVAVMNQRRDTYNYVKFILCNKQPGLINTHSPTVQKMFGNTTLGWSLLINQHGCSSPIKKHSSGKSVFLVVRKWFGSDVSDLMV